MSFITDNFELLLSKPPWVIELKKLVLELAVKGHLNSQSINDGSADELLMRLEGEKKRLVEKGVIRKAKSSKRTNIKQVPFELPKGWIWCKLNELGYFSGGGTPSKSNPEYWDGDILWVTPKDMKVPIIEDSELKITAKGVEKSSAKLIPKDSILIVARSGILKRLLPVGINAKECTVNQDIKVLIPFSKELSNYIQLLLKGHESYILDSLVKSGTTVQSLKYDQFQNHTFPLPPLPEQHRIVQKVNTLFQQIDQLAEQAGRAEATREQLRVALLHRLEQAPDRAATATAWPPLAEQFDLAIRSREDVQALRQTILQLAVKGALVPQDPKDEPAGVLLKRIKVEKERLVKVGEIRKAKALSAVKEEEVPFEVPEGWVWCRLGTAGLLDRGKSKHRPRNDQKLYTNGIYPLVQTGDVSSAKDFGGYVKTYHSQYNEFGLSQSRLWPKGTLCVTIAANIADCGFLDFDACFPDSIVGFTSVVDPILSKYVYFFILNSKKQLETFAPSTAQKNINLGILNNMYFSLPPLPEQRRIVQKVEALLRWCDELEAGMERLEQVEGKLVKAAMRV